jgi:ribonuclease BN (tRNA processing enzyme)
MSQGLYKERDTEIKKLLKSDYIECSTYEHGTEHKIAELKSEKTDDGRDVNIYETRMPARFFKIEALDTPNSIGVINKGFTLSTGSGADKLAFCIARAIQEGMLGID